MPPISKVCYDKQNALYRLYLKTGNIAQFVNSPVMFGGFEVHSSTYAELPHHAESRVHEVERRCFSLLPHMHHWITAKKYFTRASGSRVSLKRKSTVLACINNPTIFSPLAGCRGVW